MVSASLGGLPPSGGATITQANGSIRCRVQKAQAVFFYHLLESYEGLTSYSTLDQDSAQDYREIELSFSETQRTEVEALLGELTPWVYRLHPEAMV